MREWRRRDRAGFGECSAAAPERLRDMGTELTAEKLAQRALDVNVLSEAELRSVWGELGTRNVDCEQLQQLLVRRGLLTNYQLERLIQGYRTGFFYGDYKVQYSVGAGTFARVFRTTHRTTGELFAVKVLRSRFSNPKGDNPKNPEIIRSFQREGEVGKALKHPNIVAIHEVQSKGMTHFIVMDFVEGHNLRDFARVRGKFEPLEAARLVAGIVAGLTYAFQQGITHRDLKLSNVLVSSDGEAQLVDFGLAGLGGPDVDESAESGNPRTIDYAGLERATNVRKDDPRSDIFFAGCIFYQLLCGKPPMEASRDKAKRYSKTRYQDIQPISKIVPKLPLALVRVLNKSLEFNPERRYGSAGEFLADLKLTIKRLEEHGDSGAEQTSTDAGSLEGHNDEGQPRKLMIVESDTKMQDLFRELFKKRGYRVLVTSDLERLFQRFYENNRTADAVLLSSGHIGPGAVDAFNRLGSESSTKDLPAVLLLGDAHAALGKQAQATPRRAVLQMPVKSKQLRQAVLKVLKAPDTA